MICKNCSNCGVARIERSVQGVYCQKCDIWLVVTSYIAPIDLDENIYAIHISNTETSLDLIKIIARIQNVNFLAAKRFFDKGEEKIFSGRAAEVQKIASYLNQHNIDFSIFPQFPY